MVQVFRDCGMIVIISVDILDVSVRKWEVENMLFAIFGNIN